MKPLGSIREYIPQRSAIGPLGMDYVDATDDLRNK
jgi:hypothetical protein